MKTRIITAVIGIIILALVLYAGGWVLFAGVLAISLIGTVEYTNCLNHKFQDKLSVWPGLIMSLIIVITMKFDYYSIEYILILCMLICLGIEIFTAHNFNRAALRFFGEVYIPMLFGYFLLFQGTRHGMYYMIMIFIGAFASDTCAYFVGRAAGGKKLAPELSPNKTIAGSIGGIVGDIACMCLYGYILQTYFSFVLPYWEYALIGGVLSVVGQIGDLAASMMKREYGIKDFGNLFPGHGGVLDRFDAVLFVIPVVYFFATAIHG